MNRPARRVTMTDLLDPVIALGLFLVTFIAYAVTRCQFADPGICGRRVAVAAGLYPQFDLQAPLWRGISSWVGGWRGGSPTARVHLLNALLTAAAVGLLYQLVQTAIRGLCHGRSAYRRQALIASRLGGTVAALAAATSLPLWWSATRAADGVVGLLLVLVACLLLIHYVRDAAHWHLFAMAFVCGLAAAEWSPSILAIPILAGTAVIRAVTANRKWTPILSVAAGCGMLGLLLYPVTAGRFAVSVGGELRGMQSLGMALLTMCREQYRSLRYVTRETGWLITLAVTVVPCVLAMSFARDALSEFKSDDFHRRSRAWSFPFLHLAMTATAVACLANTRVAPWSAEDASGRFLLPAVMCGAVLGYVTAYWYLLPLGWWPNTTNTRKLLVRLLVGPVSALVLIAATASFSAKTLGRLDPRSGEWMARYANALLDSLNGQTWLVTDGFGDDAARLGAARRDLPLFVLNLREARHPVYKRYVAAEMALARHRNAAGLGVDALVKEIIRRDADAPLRVATTTAPSLWKHGDLLSIPRGLVFAAADRLPTRAALRDLADLHLRTRSSATVFADSPTPPATDREARIRQAILARGAMLGRHLVALLDSSNLPELAEKIRQVEAQPQTVAGLPRRSEARPASALPGIYLSATELAPDVSTLAPGRVAVDLVRQAREAAVRGSTETAEDLLNRAGEAGVPAFHIELERGILHARSGNTERALAHLKASLDANPDFIPAWIVLAGVHELLGNRAGMEDAAAALEVRSAPTAFSAAIRGRIAMRDGRLAEAADRLEAALAARPGDPSLLQQCTVACLSLGRTAQAEELAIQLLRVDPDNAMAHHVRGRQQVADNELAMAEQSLRRSVALSPTPQAMNDLAWVLHKRGKDEESERFAARAVEQAPRMSHAWHTLGIARSALGDTDGARDAFQECLRITPDHVDSRLRLGEL